MCRRDGRESTVLGEGNAVGGDVPLVRPRVEPRVAEAVARGDGEGALRQPLPIVREKRDGLITCEAGRFMVFAMRDGLMACEAGRYGFLALLVVSHRVRQQLGVHILPRQWLFSTLLE